MKDGIITAMEHRPPDGRTRGKVCFEINGSHFASHARPRLFNGDVTKCGAGWYGTDDGGHTHFRSIYLQWFR